MELYETKQQETTALLVGVDLGESDTEESMAELRELARTAGAQVAGVMVQKRPAPDTATCVGSGFLEEIGEFCRANDVSLIIFDRELSPIQMRNIEDATDIRTIDRTMLILDIFAGRARSSEGKLQVELAQLRYMLPRLTGKGIAMSRLGGGIGTRGPGETKLETDRRHIRGKIDNLKEKLAEVAGQRSRYRERRRRDGIVTVAIVGYTNAGKSTLLNTLTDAGVLSEDMLFATLDPTARALTLPSGGNVMLVDTVGFIRRLPHHLIEAFKSTLEEAVEADLILNVCDGSSPIFRDHLRITGELLAELGAAEKPVLTVINKIDAADPDNLLGVEGVRISARTGKGLDALLTAIEQALPVRKVRVKLCFPFADIGRSTVVRENGTVFAEEYTADGLELDCLIDTVTAQRLKEFVMRNAECGMRNL
ncbi:MAG: GTPase HflX [Clostridia bacterium]|nr:GTPase HflX [Clostridia bacterium]